MADQRDSLILPISLILTGILMALDQFAIIQIANLWRLWPLLLIAAGMEKLYFWATTTEGERQ